MPDVYPAHRVHRSEFLSLRGLRHHILRWGAPKAGRAPLVMVHGWMDVGASFQFVVDALQGEREVIALDWRGFGLSETTGADSYWFPDYLGDLDALLDALSPAAPVDLLGHSMGGNVVMSYAGVRPNRIRRLVNLEGFGMPDISPAAAPERLVKWLDELKDPPSLRPYATLVDVAERLMKNNPRLARDKAAWLAQHWARKVTGDGPEGFQLNADPAHKLANPMLYRKAEVLACWQRITAPTLWVEGSDDQLTRFWGSRYPRDEFESRLAVVPSLARAVLQDAGHMLHHDQPEALAAVLEPFLASD
ncbi:MULTISPECIES: alpha/beta fold hydrolase [unclassified Roseateles]|uniref:alpha/beta fold hydrolase n=1 Tax=unclassified Roseateles TaxID=2626991 RepID=UPI0006F284A6|nr:MULTISPECIES: alpha/beta hydrolase [unclassified Roseateles]KQW52051.1 alpha/beta hydrolase [Pelomonas sp. Root405]KRA78285.1 alpha/beta hydrolase [Pelomonas sp. Root662]